MTSILTYLCDIPFEEMIGTLQHHICDAIDEGCHDFHSKPLFLEDL